jgi:hypothetical protein
MGAVEINNTVVVTDLGQVAGVKIDLGAVSLLQPQG